MCRRFTLLFSLLALLFFASAVTHSKPAGPASDLRLVVYQDGFAQVTLRRKLIDDWRVGTNTLRISDLAGTIDPSTLRLRSLTDPSAVVQEQSLAMDAIEAERLLVKSIDQPIVIHTRAGKKLEGVLLSVDERQLVLGAERERGPIWVLNRGENIQRVQFPGLANALHPQPVLTCKVQATRPGPHEVELSYLAGGIRWRADYTLVLTRDDSAADLQGLVLIDNRSGTSFANAAVKLLAGEPRVAAQDTWPTGLEGYRVARRTLPADKKADDPGRAIGEYRAYTMPERVTVADKQLKQIDWIKAPKVAVAKTYLFDGGQLAGLKGERIIQQTAGLTSETRPAHVLLEIDNRAEQSLGITLPRGKLRTFKRDTDGGLEFLGEDLVAHTPRDDKLLLHIGEAFDIVGERKQLAFQRVTDKQIEEALEIKVRNRKTEPVTVQVFERMYRGPDWQIIEESHAPQRLDGRSVVFPVNIPAEGEAVVTYRVRYRY